MDVNKIEGDIAQIVRTHEKDGFLYEFLLAYGTPKSTVTKLKQQYGCAVREGCEVLVPGKIRFLRVVGGGGRLPALRTGWYKSEGRGRAQIRRAAFCCGYRL